ncbi:MAG: LacI family DNA-binding transcriptional regulator [Anaerolineae bacterium]|nr:LacI family DNA-binding transcriptional regulator [Anaerolineae bacterium]
MNRNRVTIKDVARAAGVSRQTVSRAINDRGEISEETRDRVLSIAKEMGYRPSSIARGLATQRTGTLGLVVPDVANPFFADVAQGAEHAAYAEGYSVFLCNTNEDPQRELAVLQSLEEKRVDGVVLCSSRLEENELREALTHQTAVVLLNRWLGDSNVGTVLIDDEYGGRLATEHLLQTGHHMVGFLAGPPASRSGRRRAKGYRAAMIRAGSGDPEAWILHCIPTVEGGRIAARQFLTAYPQVDAFFCYNDLVAVGALKASLELGRSIPDELAIIGFDDIPLAALVTPALTTCHVPRYELGRQAMQLLLDRIDGCTDMCRELLVQPELIIRDSAL